MHDEASTTHSDMLDQTSRGLRFLEATFGVLPSVGWQIDPFGHSATQATLLTTEVRLLTHLNGRQAPLQKSSSIA